MFRAVHERDPGLHGRSASFGGGEEEEKEEEEEEDGCGDDDDVPGTGLGAATESASATCVLWCTVAVGCLMGGRPKSSVSPTISAKRLFHITAAAVAVAVCVETQRGVRNSWRGQVERLTVHYFQGKQPLPCPPEDCRFLRPIALEEKSCRSCVQRYAFISFRDSIINSPSHRLRWSQYAGKRRLPLLL